ncbi:LysM peptidoglycan-binding domain-containing protein [Micromonospora thermarum]|uniref:LysM peptidoglycan-binding domain-containing protein n=1 Tax=Micromonospora thermarum TaxID=2720024 RepID=A0ABX0Z8Q2_9ACTN|nr:LysM domain-containing protein [Micromonospora thermarum]NJP34202.1 LysM peptidoglycan-binding domain-containing protein [Micromonospora thermarum]
MATPARTVGRVLTGFGALVLLCALLVGAPVALLALAGNPLPEQVPTLAEVGAVLTSRDDGHLLLRALALAGWAGWATFALSVLVELGALALRRPAPRLPGMSRQQRAAAALVGSVALVLAASPAAASAAAVAAGSPATALTQPATGSARLALGTAGGLDSAALASPHGTTGPVLAAPSAAARPALAAPAALASSAIGAPQAATGVTGPTRVTPTGITREALGGSSTGATPTAGRTAPADPARRAPVYRVAKGDHLGSIAERYLDSFGEYRTLARMNRLADPDRIHPGQLLRLPVQAEDRGARPHATGRLVARPVPQRPAAPVPAPDPTMPDESAATTPKGGPAVTVGAARPGDPDRVNRPLAVSAILAVSSIVGAQIGAVLGLRRRPATVRVGTSRGATAARHQRELPSGRHRRD